MSGLCRHIQHLELLFVAQPVVVNSKTLHRQKSMWLFQMIETENLTPNPKYRM